MDKIKYIEKLFNTLRYEQETNERWIIPEYKENLSRFISDVSEEILGKELNDLVYDVALEQCRKGKINDKEYNLTTLDELLIFIKDTNLINE